MRFMVRARRTSAVRDLSYESVAAWSTASGANSTAPPEVLELMPITLVQSQLRAPDVPQHSTVALPQWRRLVIREVARGSGDLEKGAAVRRTGRRSCDRALLCYGKAAPQQR